MALQVNYLTGAGTLSPMRRECRKWAARNTESVWGDSVLNTASRLCLHFSVRKSSRKPDEFSRLAAIHLSLFEQQIHRGRGLQQLDRVLHQITFLRAVPAKLHSSQGLPSGLITWWSDLSPTNRAVEAVEGPGLDPLWRFVR